MFNWLRTKQKNEFIKLLYQNSSALEFFIETAKNQDILAIEKLSSYRDQIEVIANNFNYEDRENLKTLLKINKEMRILFSSQTLSKIKSFDKTFCPLLGWKSYYDDFM